MASKKTKATHLPDALDKVRSFPRMFIAPLDFNNCASFVQGFDAAWGGGLLLGFREWLAVKIDEEPNLAWPAFVVRLAQKSGKPKFNPEEDEPQNIIFLLDALDEFLSERAALSGSRIIFIRYDDWLRSQKRYGPTSPNWVPRQADLAKKPRKAKVGQRRS